MLNQVLASYSIVSNILCQLNTKHVQTHKKNVEFNTRPLPERRFSISLHSLRQNAGFQSIQRYNFMLHVDIRQHHVRDGSCSYCINNGCLASFWIFNKLLVKYCFQYHAPNSLRHRRTDSNKKLILTCWVWVDNKQLYRQTSSVEHKWIKAKYLHNGESIM